MITSCPQCQTHFRVAAKELAVRQGMVRCGRCALVFNGFAHLARDKSAIARPPSTQADETSIPRLSGHIGGSPQPSGAPAFAAAGNEEPQTLTAAAAKRSVSRDGPVPTSPVKSISSPAPETAIAELLNVEALQTFADSLEKAEAVEVETAKDLTPLNEESPQRAHRPHVDPILFRPDLYEQAYPKRGIWGAACLLLALALTMQLVYFLRTEIAANWPSAKPYLAAFCSSFDCQVSLPRQIDHLTIETSELLADPGRPNVVLVTAIVRNHGATTQAYPSLEITLTDAFDQPLARRSVDAPNYLPASRQREEGITAGAEIIAKTAIQTRDIKPSGYRLRLYYR